MLNKKGFKVCKRRNTVIVRICKLLLTSNTKMQSKYNFFVTPHSNCHPALDAGSIYGWLCQPQIDAVSSTA